MTEPRVTPGTTASTGWPDPKVTVQAVPKGQVIRFRCEDHGEVWSAAVWCQHDIEHEMKAVSAAHRAPYGADCQAPMQVQVFDAETMQENPPTGEGEGQAHGMSR